MRRSAISTSPPSSCLTFLSRATVVTLHHTLDLPSDLTDPNSQKKPEDVIGLAIGDQSGETRVRLYAGPKELDC